ncbi:MAG: hypothetical protein DYG89_03215 [Caldilinea sp. CFX5]|nr:hypothetical protein [Caldilinea sp. CFX5]
MERAGLALADFGCQVGNSLLTGQREEAGLGLYYYGARWYDPALGRFIQPDTIVPNPGDVQSFDRYAYVNNNPLKYSDPSGHYAICFQEGFRSGNETDTPDLTTVVNTLCSELAERGLLGKSGQYGLFGSGQEGIEKAMEFLSQMQQAHPDEEFILIGYSFGGGAALEFARLLDPWFGDSTKVDVMITIDPVVSTRGWPVIDRMKQAAFVYWYPLPFNNVDRVYNVLAELNRYGVITPFDQGVEVPGADGGVLPGTHHCSVGHARCAGYIEFGSVQLVPDGIRGDGDVNPLTKALIIDYLKPPQNR